MSPSIESIAGRRRSVCYIIEEEPCCDSQVDNNGLDSQIDNNGLDSQIDNSGIKEQSETDCQNHQNLLSEVRLNINRRNNELDNVKYTEESGHPNVFSKLLDLTEAADENDDTITSASPVSTRKLSTGRRREVSQLSTNTRLSPAISNGTTLNKKQQNVEISSNHEVKSGNLVMIISEQRQSSTSCISSHPTSRTLSRYPVIVKIHQRSYEKYAIVSRTRRHSTMPTFFLKLKHSHVIHSSSNPSHFIVTDNGPAAKSITFEASNPETAIQWINAFSQDFSYSPASSVNGPHFYERKERVPRGRIQQANSSMVSSEAAPARTVPRSYVMPALSESFAEDDSEQTNISALTN